MFSLKDRNLKNQYEYLDPHCHILGEVSLAHPREVREMI